MKKYMILISWNFEWEEIHFQPFISNNIPSLDVKLFLDLFSKHYSNNWLYLCHWNYNEINNIIKKNIKDYNNFEKNVLNYFNDIYMQEYLNQHGNLEWFNNNYIYDNLRDLMDQLVPINNYWTIVSQSINIPKILEIKEIDYNSR